MTTLALCLNQILTFSAPSKKKYFENIAYLCQDSMVKGVGVFFVTNFYFTESQSFVEYSPKYM